MARERSFDRVAAVYERTRAIPAEAARAVTAGIAGAIAAIASPGRLLDVGVGTGRIAVPLAAAGVRVVGIDISPDMLARLAAKGPGLPVVFGDAAALPFRAASFDAALFVHVLHLVPDPVAMLRSARTVVRPGGLLLGGRTEYGPGLRRRAIDLVWETLHELGSPPRPAVDWNAATTAAFEAVVGAAGDTTATSVLARWTERTTGRRVLDDLAARTYSSTWAIPDRLMPGLLARLEPRLRDLLGDLARPYDTEVTFALTSAQVA